MLHVFCFNNKLNIPYCYQKISYYIYIFINRVCSIKFFDKTNFTLIIDYTNNKNCSHMEHVKQIQFLFVKKSFIFVYFPREMYSHIHKYQ